MAKQTLLVEVASQDREPITDSGSGAVLVAARTVLEVHVIHPEGRRRVLAFTDTVQLGGYQFGARHAQEGEPAVIEVQSVSAKGRPFATARLETPGVYRLDLEVGARTPLTATLLCDYSADPVHHILYRCRLPFAILRTVAAEDWPTQFENDWAVDRDGTFAIQVAPRPERHSEQQRPWERVTQIKLRAGDESDERNDRLAKALAQILFGPFADAKFLEIYDPNSPESLFGAKGEEEHLSWANPDKDEQDEALLRARKWVESVFEITPDPDSGCGFLIGLREHSLTSFPDLMSASWTKGGDKGRTFLIHLPKLHELPSLEILRRLVRRFGYRLFARWGDERQRDWLLGLYGTRTAAQYIANHYPICRVTRGSSRLVKIQVDGVWHYVNFKTRNLGSMQQHEDRDREVLEKHVDLAPLLRIECLHPSEYSHTLEQELWARAAKCEEQAAFYGIEPWLEANIRVDYNDDGVVRGFSVCPTAKDWGGPDDNMHTFPVGTPQGWVCLGENRHDASNNEREATRRMFDRFWRAAYVVNFKVEGKIPKPLKPDWKRGAKDGLNILGFLTDGSTGYIDWVGRGGYPGTILLEVPDGEIRHFLFVVSSWNWGRAQDRLETSMMCVMGVTVSRVGGKVKFSGFKGTPGRCYDFGDCESRFFAEVLRRSVEV